MSVYINGIGAVTPQGCFPSTDFLKKMNVFEHSRLTVVEPEYKKYIKPVPLRRMSKFIKMGVSSALMCLDDADIEKPDAIITATGLGAVEDTDKFLDNLTDDNEKLLNPTPFIQSTHNTVAARIAIETGCLNYNMTYVHKNAAFEQALLDAFLKINSGNYRNVLVGGIEEITETNFILKKNVDFWKKNVSNADLMKNKTSKGTIAGEGSVFYVMSAEKTTHSYAKIKSSQTYYKLNSGLTETVIDFLEQNRSTPNDIDMILLGTNGNIDEDFIYDSINNELFNNVLQGWYKHLCGEYETSSAFAIMIAAQILKSQNIPDFVILNDKQSSGINNILVYQQRFNRNHCFTLLSKC